MSKCLLPAVGILWMGSCIQAFAAPELGKKVAALDGGLSGLYGKAQAQLEQAEGGIKSSHALDAFKQYKKMLSSPVEAVRIKGLLKLDGQEGSKDIVDMLKKHLLKSEGDEKGLTLAVLLRQKVKGLASEFAGLKSGTSVETKMRMAYNARYVDDPGLAPELLKMFQNDKDELVQEYALLGLQSQSQNVDLKALKVVQDKGGLPPALTKTLDETIKKVETKIQSGPAPQTMPDLGQPAQKSAGAR